MRSIKYFYVWNNKKIVENQVKKVTKNLIYKAYWNRMFTKKSIIKHSKTLLSLLIFHFIWMTFIKFQIWGDLWVDFLQTSILNLWKDIYLMFIYFLIFVYAVKNKDKIKINKKIFFFFLAVLFTSIWVSLLHFNWIKTLVLWFKYDLWFLFPVIFFSVLNLEKSEVNKFYDLFIDLLKIVLILCLLFALLRFSYPNFLFLLWYWPIWDWSLDSHPPILFQTWLNWVQRLSWIFSWPNHMAFYLVAFAGILLLSIVNKRIHRIWWVLLTILLFGTLSRSGIWAFVIQIWILAVFFFIYKKDYRKILGALFWLWLILASWIWWYLFVSWKYNDIILRWASTAWHVQRFSKTVEEIRKNPILWHGIWTAWPSAHYIKSDVIPESWFLQIFYEIGVFAGLIWFLFIFYIMFVLYKKQKINYSSNMSKVSILTLWSIIWIIWLLIQWVVLHSFEDSMISIPLFILIGILLSLKKQDD